MKEEDLVSKLKNLYESKGIFDPELTELARKLENEFRNPYAAYIQYVIMMNDPNCDDPDHDWAKFAYLEDAADGGIPEGLYELGCTYFHGHLGYEVDYELAFIYLSSARSAGFNGDEGELEVVKNGIKNMTDYMKLMMSDATGKNKLSQLKLWLNDGSISEEIFDQSKGKLLES